METFNHKCINKDCQNIYQDSDPDPYYCEPCQAERKRIAEDLDKKFSSRSHVEPMTPLKEYDRAAKVNVNGMQFVKVNL